MELTEDRFKSILGALRGDAHAGDKRRQPRVGISCTVRLLPADNDKPAVPRTARVRDIAKSGLGLILPRPLALGRRLLVQLPTLEDRAMLILCQVCHCSSLDKAYYTVGLSFLKQGYAQIAPPAQPDSEEQRIRKAILD